MPCKYEISQEELKKYLKYDSETGIFIWVMLPSRRVKRESQAGYKNKLGYIEIRFKGDLYLAHRLAWFLHFKEWPKGQIDHIDGNPTNNRISNLRDVDERANHQNQKKHRNGNKVGASFNNLQKKWTSFIYYERKAHYLGRFDTEQEAHEAYLKALKHIKSRGIN